jgi:hypothetical protein
MGVGATLESGHFVRNLKRDWVAKRYQKDDDENPLYGVKLTARHWKYADKNLSVNLLSCTHSLECSIAIQADESYVHAAVIDLEGFNRRASLTLVAVYQPDENLQNRCHFELMPLNGTVLSWMAIASDLDRPFPPAKNLPITDIDKATAMAEAEKYDSYFRIQRWVRPKNADGAS